MRPLALVDDMAKGLQLDGSFIQGVAKRSALYYRTLHIPKANGGTRLIHHPSPVLKALQYWVLERVLRRLRVSEHAVAYRTGMSVRSNASLHANQKHIFHTDIVKFFPSITSGMVDGMLARGLVHLSGDDRDLVCRICLRHGHCTIGAVTSPALSNAVMADFDDVLGSYASRESWVYTRYADDIVLSSRAYIGPAVVGGIRGIMREYGFEMHAGKTYFMGPGGRRAVTGVVITTDGRVSVGRARKESIRRMVYNYFSRNEGDPSVILGHLSFLKGVDPWSYNAIVVKYGHQFHCHVVRDLLGHVRGS